MKSFAAVLSWNFKRASVLFGDASLRSTDQSTKRKVKDEAHRIIRNPSRRVLHAPNHSANSAKPYAEYQRHNKPGNQKRTYHPPRDG